MDAIGADLLAEPSPNAARIADLPEGTPLVPLTKDEYFIKVKAGGKIGWVSTAGLVRHMAMPGPDLEFHHGGYKIVGGEYRYFFGFTNRGVQTYKGPLSVHLYAGEVELALLGIGDSRVGTIAYQPGEKTAHGYPVNPGDEVTPGQVRAYYLVASQLATRYVFETAQGKVEGKVGEQIGR